MFDCGVGRLIEGRDIDHPRNALTLSRDLHTDFGNFETYFEAIADQPHAYVVKTFLPAHLAADPPLPVTRTFSDNQNVEPPSPRLLAIHSAIAHILHLSAAGDYIDELLRDAEEKGIQADGSTELGRLLHLGLGVWAEDIAVS